MKTTYKMNYYECPTGWCGTYEKRTTADVFDELQIERVD